MELWLVSVLGKAKANLQRVVGKQQNWHWIFPQNVPFFFVSVTLLGLVRIFKTRHHWKYLSFLMLLFTDLLT